MRRWMGWALALAVVAGGCDGDEPEQTATIEPPPSTEETTEATSEAPPDSDETPERVEGPEPDPSPEDPSQPPLPTAEPGRAHVFVVPEGAELAIALDTDIIYGGGEFDVEDARMERLLNDRLGALARTAIADAHLGGGGEEVSASCDVPLTSDHVLGVVCDVHDYGERGESEHRKSAYHLAIEGGAVRDLSLAELFVPGTDLEDLVNQGCARARAEDPDLPECDAEAYTRAVVLDLEGLTVHVFDPYDSADEQVSFSIPYADVADRLLARGPLALALDRAGVRTRAVEVDPSEPAPGETRRASRWVAGPMAPVGELATAWSTLTPELRERARVEGGYLVGPDEATARAIARVLGSEASQVDVHLREGAAPLALQIAQTNRELELAELPYSDAAPVGSLPRGTVVAAAGPLGAPDSFVYVHAHADLAGYVQARRLSVADVCAPDVGPFLATLPEAARRDARLRTRRDVRTSGSWGRATFVVEVGDASHVELRRIEAGCATDRSLVRFTVPKPLEQLTVTRTARRGGESVIVAVHGGASRAVRAYVFGNPEPVWTRPLSARDRVETSVQDGREWFPVAIHPASGAALRLTWSEEGPRLSE